MNMDTLTSLLWWVAIGGFFGGSDGYGRDFLSGPAPPSRGHDDHLRNNAAD